MSNKEPNTNGTKRKRYIEDSEEVREVIADLKAKVKEQQNADIQSGDTGTSNSETVKKVIREPERAKKTVQDAEAQSPERVKKTVQDAEAQSPVRVKKPVQTSEPEEYEEDDFDEINESEYDYAEYDNEEIYEEEEYYEDEDYLDEDYELEEGEVFVEAPDENHHFGDVVRESELERKRSSQRQKEEKNRKENKGVNDKNTKSDKKVKKAAFGKKGKKTKEEDDVIISMENVTKSYIKGVPALNDVSLKIRKGEFVFIVGSSGSGKSTLIKLLLHELKPDSGSIMVNGFQVDKLRHGKIPKLRRSLGVVFQNFRLLPDMNVYENVAFAQRIIQVPLREMKRNVPSMLAMVGLAGKYNAKTNELSGGEQQRVAFARALVNNPPILLADEPTGNLDPQNTMEIMGLLEQINQNGTTVIVVTHDDKIVNAMKKRVITIKKGTIVSDEERGGYIDED